MVKSDTLLLISDAVNKISLSDEQLSEIFVSCEYLHLFDDVADFRQKAKISYELKDILMMAFITILERGKQSFTFISTYVSVNKRRFQKMGILKGDAIPSHDTFRRIFSLLDSSSFQKATIDSLYDFLKQFEENKGLSLRGLDGKYVNSSGRSKECDHCIPNSDVINIYELQSSTCICSIPVGEKTNEIPEAQKLLEQMDLKNCIITADALHCQALTTSIIRKNKGHYLICTKDNQQLLVSDIMSRFSDKRNARKIIREEIKDEKDKLISSIEILKLPSGFIYEDFKDIRSYVKLTSHKRKDTTCIRYFITSLVKKEDILASVLNRWSIENDLHKFKDDFLHEDEFRCTDKKAIRNIVLMNNLIAQLTRIYMAFSGYDLYTAKIALQSNPYEELSKMMAIMSSKTLVEKIKDNINKKNG